MTVTPTPGGGDAGAVAAVGTLFLVTTAAPIGALILLVPPLEGGSATVAAGTAGATCCARLKDSSRGEPADKPAAAALSAPCTCTSPMVDTSKPLNVTSASPADTPAAIAAEVEATLATHTRLERGEVEVEEEEAASAKTRPSGVEVNLAWMRAS